MMTLDAMKTFRWPWCTFRMWLHHSLCNDFYYVVWTTSERNLEGRMGRPELGCCQNQLSQPSPPLRPLVVQLGFLQSSSLEGKSSQRKLDCSGSKKCSRADTHCTVPGSTFQWGEESASLWGLLGLGAPTGITPKFNTIDIQLELILHGNFLKETQRYLLPTLDTVKWILEGLAIMPI